MLRWFYQIIAFGRREIMEICRCVMANGVLEMKSQENGIMHEVCELSKRVWVCCGLACESLG
jgi:hypothetical protein